MDSILEKITYVVIGVAIGLVFTILVNDAAAQFLSLQTEQEEYYKDTGEYISDPQNGVHTYTTLCKGYYYDDGQGTVIGYGDSKEQFTYEYEKVLATSTDIIPTTDTLR